MDPLNITNSSKLSSLIERVSPAVVQISVTAQENNFLTPYRIPTFKQFVSSGFICQLNSHFKFLITNAHVVENAEQIYVRSSGGDLMISNLIHICRERDLAICEVPLQLKDVKPLQPPPDSKELPPGTPVVTLGYPLSENSLKITSGIISGFNCTNKKDNLIGIEDIYRSSPPMYQITAPLNFGNSGGALIDVRGYVIGITVGGNPEAHGVGYALSIYSLEWIAEILRPNEIEVFVPNWGFCWSRSTPRLVKALAPKLSGIGPGIYIREVYLDSTLRLNDEITLQMGDLLLSIESEESIFEIQPNGLVRLLDRNSSKGSKIERLINLNEIYPLIRINSGIKFTVIRNGTLLSLRVPYRPVRIPRIRDIYPGISIEDRYLSFAGGCWAQLTSNIIKSLEENNYNLNEVGSVSIFEPAVVLTSIHPRSQLEQESIFTVGSVLHRLNGVLITNIDDIDRIRSSNPNLFLFESRSGVMMALTPHEINFQDNCLTNN